MQPANTGGRAHENDHQTTILVGSVKLSCGTTQELFGMANFIVSYDLNGPTPSHKQVDDHLEKIGAARGRILETVWYVGWSGTLAQLLDHMKQIVSSNDLLLVVEAREATWTSLLIEDAGLLQAWKDNR